jgi:hypothetical protein
MKTKTKRPSSDGDSKSRTEKGSSKWKIVTGVLGLVIGTVGWYLKDCLAEQKTALRETRDAWVSVRETSQRYIDERVALNEQLALFYRRQLQDNPNVEWIDARKKELITLTEADESACNAAKNARYDFAGKLQRTCHNLAVSCPTELAPMAFIEKMCGTALQAAARLRAANSVNLAKTPYQLRVGPYGQALAVIAQENQIFDATRIAERDHNQRVEEFLNPLEKHGLWSHAWSCVKAATGS